MIFPLLETVQDGSLLGRHELPVFYFRGAKISRRSLEGFILPELVGWLRGFDTGRFSFMGRLAEESKGSPFFFSSSDRSDDLFRVCA
jgi:hypothetical protein